VKGETAPRSARGR